MENKQVNNQEKPFEDKRNIDEMSIPSLYPHTFITSSGVGASDAFKKALEEAIAKKGGVEFVRNDLGQWIIKEEPKEETPEEWIWVDGYKGTDSEMKCKDYQYVLGKQHDMPEDAKIVDCESGFHLCRDLDDVFRYYGINNGNRFFRVHALVRKKDFDEYGVVGSRTGYYSRRRNKLVAKSIVFVRELTNDEVLKGTDAENWSEEDKNMARAHGVQHVKDIHNVATLISLGYSEAFAKYIVDSGHFEAAYAAGTQEGLSMDMKVAFIMRNEY